MPAASPSAAPARACGVGVPLPRTARSTAAAVAAALENECCRRQNRRQAARTVRKHQEEASRQRRVQEPSPCYRQVITNQPEQREETNGYSARDGRRCSRQSGEDNARSATRVTPPAPREKASTPSPPSLPRQPVAGGGTAEALPFIAARQRGVCEGAARGAGRRLAMCAAAVHRW